MECLAVQSTTTADSRAKHVVLASAQHGLVCLSVSWTVIGLGDSLRRAERVQRSVSVRARRRIVQEREKKVCAAAASQSEQI